jgi:hypothetical protein
MRTCVLALLLLCGAALPANAQYNGRYNPYYWQQLRNQLAARQAQERDVLAYSQQLENNNVQLQLQALQYQTYFANGYQVLQYQYLQNQVWSYLNLKHASQNRALGLYHSRQWAVLDYQQQLAYRRAGGR